MKSKRSRYKIKNIINILLLLSLVFTFSACSDNSVQPVQNDEQSATTQESSKSSNDNLDTDTPINYAEYLYNQKDPCAFKDENNNTIYALVVSSNVHEDKTVQLFSSKSDKPSTISLNESEMVINVEFMDVNFDNCLDIVVNTGGTVNETHDLYIWDSHSESFIKVTYEGFDMLSFFTVCNGYIENFLRGSSPNDSGKQKLIWNGNVLVKENVFPEESPAFTKKDALNVLFDYIYDAESKAEMVNLRFSDTDDFFGYEYQRIINGKLADPWCLEFTGMTEDNQAYIFWLNERIHYDGEFDHASTGGIFSVDIETHEITPIHDNSVGEEHYKRYSGLLNKYFENMVASEPDDYNYESIFADINGDNIKELVVVKTNFYNEDAKNDETEVIVQAYGIEAGKVVMLGFSDFGYLCNGDDEATVKIVTYNKKSYLYVEYIDPNNVYHWTYSLYRLSENSNFNIVHTLKRGVYNNADSEKYYIIDDTDVSEDVFLNDFNKIEELTNTWKVNYYK